MPRSYLANHSDPFIHPSRIEEDRAHYLASPIKPHFCESRRLWHYGNRRLLLADLATLDFPRNGHCSERELDEVERVAQELVLSGKVLVCGIHNEAHRRAALVPLRWGAPRILVFSGGFYHHLGESLSQEPFRTARWWRYEWDPGSDLAVSLRAPTKLPTYALENPTVDRLIRSIVDGLPNGISSIPRQATLLI